MTFTEASTVENLVRDLLCGGVTQHTAVGPGFARKQGKLAGLGWHYLAAANVPMLAGCCRSNVALMSHAEPTC